MSRKDNCWDNAVMERFSTSLKTERVWQRDDANHAEATTDIADCEEAAAIEDAQGLHEKLALRPTNKTAALAPLEAVPA